ncbi:MAG: ribonuclease H-like domain-containing protein, partial [Candidatus Nanopelagicales bacterium]
STPEPSNLCRIAQEALNPDLPDPEQVDALITETFVDLYPIMRANFFSRDGLGLKVVATRGAGFAWRDEDPGGLQSITWLEQVRAGDSHVKQRVLEYNEDDVRATLALRNWLSD